MRLASDPAPLVPLLNGDVLVGNDVEFYNPGTENWVNTGALSTIAGSPSQESLLNTGNVLASGTRCKYSGCRLKPTVYCYLYATSTNTWSRTGNMNAPRVNHSSTLLPNGQVLVAGGYGPNATLSSAELYTP